MSDKKLRVGILFGGKSGEHEVSLTSAQNVMDAIDRDKYTVVPIGISKDGLWLTGKNVMGQLTAHADFAPQLAARIEESSQRSLIPFLDESVAAGSELGQIDVIFPILHGPLGEDGTVQGMLELANLPYVGCGVAGSAVAMDKGLAKGIFKAAGLPVVADVVTLRKTWQRNPASVITEAETTLTYPMFVKPANLGSSVGISKAHHRAELEAALNEAARFDRRLVIEQGIDAREIEVSVLGNDDPVASVPGEVIPSREFYSYASKYIDGDSGLLIPAPLSAEQTAEIQQLAVKAFLALDAAGLSRVDFLVDKDSGEIYLNEVNTMPGFTAISMYPKLWEASGLGYTQLIDKLIELALERHADKQQSTSDFNVSEAT